MHKEQFEENQRTRALCPHTFPVVYSRGAPPPQSPPAAQNDDSNVELCVCVCVSEMEEGSLAQKQSKKRGKRKIIIKEIIAKDKNTKGGNLMP